MELLELEDIVSALASTCLPSTGSSNVRLKIPLSKSKANSVSWGLVTSCTNTSGLPATGNGFNNKLTV